MLSLIDSRNEGSIIDLGSGWGTLVIAAACKNPNKQVVGYELSWLPWLVSITRKYSLGLDNLTICRKDFNNAELNKFSVIFCYLFPQGMTALYEKLKVEQLSKIVVVSNTFALASCQATKVVKLNDAYRTPIYVYHWDPAESISIEYD
jgi:predicted RNA methylase